MVLSGLKGLELTYSLLGELPAGNISHKPKRRLPLLSAWPSTSTSPASVSLPLASTNLYYSVNKVNGLPRFAAYFGMAVRSNQQPLDY